MSLNPVTNISSPIYTPQPVQNFTAVSNTVTTTNYANSDLLNVSTAKSPLINQNISIPETQTSFFNRGEVRLAGLVLGSATVGGLIGAGIGNAFGRLALGASIGGGIGAIIPIALVAYAIKNFQ